MTPHAQNPECIQTMNALAGDVEQLRHTVFGNGKVGLKTEVELIKMQIDGFNKFLWLIISGIVTSAVCGLGSVALLLVKLFVQHGG